MMAVKPEGLLTEKAGYKCLRLGKHLFDSAPGGWSTVKSQRDVKMTNILPYPLLLEYSVIYTIIIFFLITDHKQN